VEAIPRGCFWCGHRDRDRRFRVAVLDEPFGNLRSDQAKQDAITKSSHFARLSGGSGSFGLGGITGPVDGRLAVMTELRPSAKGLSRPVSRRMIAAYNPQGRPERISSCVGAVEGLGSAASERFHLCRGSNRDRRDAMNLIGGTERRSGPAACGARIGHTLAVSFLPAGLLPNGWNRDTLRVSSGAKLSCVGRSV
jgi:hypothetical protein